MTVLFTDCGNDDGDFKTPGRMWEYVYNLPEYPAGGSDAEAQTDLINALIKIDGVGGIGFEDEVIHVSKLGVSWDELRPRVEATIQAFVVV